MFPYEPGSTKEEFKSPLQKCPNTILTPHVGGSTEEAQSSIGVEVARKLVNGTCVWRLTASSLTHAITMWLATIFCLDTLDCIHQHGCHIRQRELP